MAPRLATSLTLAALVVLGWNGRAAAKAAPTPCPGGTFVVQGRLLAAAGVTLVERVVLGDAEAIITSGCTVPAALTLKPKGKRTSVTALWPVCTGITGAAKLKAKLIAPACDVLKGALVAKGSKPKKRKFTANRLPAVLLPDGQAFGAEGGTFTNPADGTSVSVPPGAYGPRQSGKVAVAAVPLDAAAAALGAYGIDLPAGFRLVGAVQVTLHDDPQQPEPSPAPALALTVGIPEPPGLEAGDAVLNVLLEPNLAGGFLDDRASQVLFDGEAVRGNGQLSMQIAPQNLAAAPAPDFHATAGGIHYRPLGDPFLDFEPPTNLAIAAPRTSFCLVEGLVVANKGAGGESYPFRGMVVAGIFGGRSSADGFFRAAVPAGSHTLSAIDPTDGKSIGGVAVNCDPATTPLIHMDLVCPLDISPAGTNVEIVDPAGDISLAEGTTSYNVTGTAGVSPVEIVVRNITSADPGFRNTVPALGGFWAQTVILGAGRNTVVAMTGSGGDRRVARRTIDVAGLPGGLKFTLTWTTDDTDIDLHVRTPSGAEIDYTNTAADGGVLDADDQDGRGPENVTFAHPPDGKYSFSAVYFRGSVPTPVTILVIAQGRLLATFSDTLDAEGSRYDAGSVTWPSGVFGGPG